MKVTPSKRPLTTGYLDKVYTELDEVAVAVSVVGTTVQMIEKLAALVDPITEALVGTRPKVNSVRGDLQRSTHNARRTRPTASEASEAIWDMAKAVKAARKLVVVKRLGDVPIVVDVGEFSLFNVWGYSIKELAPLKQELKRVSNRLVDLGLEAAAGTVVLDEKRARGKAFLYDGDEDFVSNAKKAVKRVEILEQIGFKVWGSLFEKRHWDMWGMRSRKFAKAFVSMVEGEKQDDDTTARLRATVGRIASKTKAA